MKYIHPARGQVGVVTPGSGQAEVAAHRALGRPNGPDPSMATSSSASAWPSRTPTADPNSPANMLPCTKAPRLPNMGLISTSGSASIKRPEELLVFLAGLGYLHRGLLRRYAACGIAPAYAGRCYSSGLAGDAEHRALRVAGHRHAADRGVERFSQHRPAQFRYLRHGSVCVADGEVHVPVIGHARHLRRGRAADHLPVDLEQCVLSGAHVHRRGGQAQHVGVERDDARGGGDELVPDDRAWLVHQRGADVLVSLPQRHRRAGRVQDERHPPGVHDVERRHGHLAAPGFDPGHRVVD